MTLLSNPILSRATIPQLCGVLNVGWRTARAVFDVVAGVLSAPPWRRDIADLYAGSTHAEVKGTIRIERLCSYETSRFF